MAKPACAQTGSISDPSIPAMFSGTEGLFDGNEHNGGLHHITTEKQPGRCDYTSSNGVAIRAKRRPFADIQQKGGSEGKGLRLVANE